MATPHISGVVALMLQANPVLTPTDVTAVLTTTATAMPGYQPYQVGPGYVDAFAATALATKTSGTGTCTTRGGKQLQTLVTSESYSGTVGVGVADAGAAYHDVHPFQVAAKAIRVTVTINWTTPQDLDLQVFDPSGTLATSSGNFPGVTTETATKRDGSCTGSLPGAHGTPTPSDTSRSRRATRGPSRSSTS